VDLHGDGELEAGRRLRARLLDPVLAVAPDAELAFVCGDDLTFLVPLDALPGHEAGVRLGDRVSFVNEVSFARLLHPQAEATPTPGLLALGGVDYAASSVAPDGLSSVSAPIEVASARGPSSCGTSPSSGRRSS